MGHRSDVIRLDITSQDRTSNMMTYPSNKLGATHHRLGTDTYNLNGLTLARRLLGTVLVRHQVGGVVLRGRVVETEAYLGVDDGACHCYRGKKTARNATMFMPPGTAYVYNLYYSYCCLNLSCQGQ